MVSRRMEGGRVNEKIAPQVQQVEQVLQYGQGVQGDQIIPQGIQVPIGGQGNDVLVIPPEITNGEIREALVAVARAVTTHVNKGIEPVINFVERTMTSIFRESVRMHPLIFWDLM